MSCLSSLLSLLKLKGCGLKWTCLQLRFLIKDIRIAALSPSKACRAQLHAGSGQHLADKSFYVKMHWGWWMPPTQLGMPGLFVWIIKVLKSPSAQLSSAMLGAVQMSAKAGPDQQVPWVWALFLHSGEDGGLKCVSPNTAIQLSQRPQLSGWIFTEGLANF